MKTASEIFETPEASGFDKVTPDKRVEKRVEKFWETVMEVNVQDIKSETVYLVSDQNIHELLAKHHQDLMSEFETKLNEVVQVVSDDEFHINPTKMTELLAFIKSK